MLKGKTAIVTGAAKGIGFKIAETFVKNNANVVLVDNDVENGIKALSLIENYGSAIFFDCDVSNSEMIIKAVEKTVTSFGQIDILINNAGIQTIRDFFDLPEHEWRRVIDVNLTGAFLFSQIAGKKMEKGGSIVNMSSFHSEFPRLKKFHYDASKAGLNILTKEMALVFAPMNITVNAISLGVFATPMNNDWINDMNYVNKVVSKIPLGKIGDPKDVADVVLFLVSPQARYITGSIVTVDGGKSLIG